MKYLFVLLILLLAIPARGQIDSVGVGTFQSLMSVPENLEIGDIMEMNLRTGKIIFKQSVDSAAREFAQWVAQYYSNLCDSLRWEILKEQAKFSETISEYRADCAKDSVFVVFRLHFREEPIFFKDSATVDFAFGGREKWCPSLLSYWEHPNKPTLEGFEAWLKKKGR